MAHARGEVVAIAAPFLKVVSVNSVSGLRPWCFIRDRSGILLIAARLLIPRCDFPIKAVLWAISEGNDFDR